jgi:hypothetical protein
MGDDLSFCTSGRTNLAEATSVQKVNDALNFQAQKTRKKCKYLQKSVDSLFPIFFTGGAGGD